MRRAAIPLLFGAVLATATSHAAVVADPAIGDIFLGVRAAGGQGGSTSYLVNIGSDLIFRNATPGSTIDLGLGNLAADLASTYGANWFERTDLHWGVFGTRASASSTVYASRERLVPDIQSIPWPVLDATGRNHASSQISSVIEGTNGYRGREATDNSLVAVLQPNTASASSYNYQVATAGTTDFGSLSQWSNIEGSGFDGTNLDFYRISGSSTEPVQFLGYFSFSESGVLSFTAVPEPSMAVLGGLGSLILLTRRRRETVTR